jgi:antitoxin component of MazEF toxin-antitoxin module
MYCTARLGKRSLIRLPDEVIKKLGLKEGDIIVFNINKEVKLLKAQIKIPQ